MDQRKDLLLASAARLYSLGVDLEAARERLRGLVEQGVGYESEEMRGAFREFQDLERQWRGLEREYLNLRGEK
ncbi:MAG: hypothetical protein IJF88_08930 [Oscillospiraceae bacterium]|nr:hypothetical protein [Oscillospiraceae bacterium]